MSEVVEIRNCHALEEFHACVALQREIWGEADLEVEPATLFVVAAHTGGQVIGAFAGDVLVGFVLAVAGVRDGTPYLHSHMTGVKDGFRDRGVGRALKLFQRDEALGRDIRLIEWTFDPLELRNAHFNLNRLGAICCRYLPNLYGVTTSPLHRGLRTDRLLAEWNLEESRVVALAEGVSQAPEGMPSFLDSPAGEEVEGFFLAVPASLPYGVGQMISGVSVVQDQLRTAFTEAFDAGYMATAVVIGESPAYVLARARH